MNQARQIAHKVTVKEILEGNYEKTEGWQPNYVVIKGKNVSRVNILAAVIEKKEDNGKFVVAVDDGTGIINLREFQSNLLADTIVGDAVTIIGRPREFGNEKYIIPEIIRKVDSKSWIEFRKRELGHIPIEETKKEPGKVVSADNVVERLYNIIRELDTGEGADYDEVLKRSGYENSQRVIQSLIEDGEVFEARPGRLKLL